MQNTTELDQKMRYMSGTEPFCIVSVGDDLGVPKLFCRYPKASPGSPLHFCKVFEAIKKVFESIWWQENQLCLDKKN